MIIKLNSDLVEFLDSIKGTKSRVSLIVSILQEYKLKYTDNRNDADTLTSKDKNEHITIRNKRAILKD